jgi:uncharacterized protein (TIGR03437 family)
VVNAASSAPAGVSNGAIARGSIFTIYGTGLGPTPGVSVSAFPLSTTLQGVTVTIAQGQAQVSAIPVYASATQLNVVMPSNAPLGLQPLYVTYNGRKSNPSPVMIVNTALGLTAVNGGGYGPGAIQHNATGQINSTQVTAAPGDVITVYGTGLGPATGPDNVAPPVANLPTAVSLFVGGVAAKILYSGRSPCCSGLDQLTFEVPANAPSGCWVPVYAVAAGVTSNAVTMAIDSKAAPCSEPANPLAQKFLQGGTVGTVRLYRSTVHEDIAVAAPVDIANDVFFYDFARTAANQFGYSFLFSQPPAGSCNLLTQAGDFWIGTTAGPVSPPKRLNPGSSFTLTGASGPQNLTVAPSARAAYLGTFAPFVPGLPNRLTLAPGNYTIAGGGGPDVGAFQAQAAVPAAFTWINRDQVSSVDRTKPLTLTWSGSGAQQSMGILGGSVDLPSNSSAIFFCMAAPGASSFTIPAEVLNAVPAARANPLRSKGAIYLFNATIGNGVPFTAPGLDAAVAITGHLQGRTVSFQ